MLRMIMRESDRWRIKKKLDPVLLSWPLITDVPNRCTSLFGRSD
jgi:hypothetical protein